MNLAAEFMAMFMSWDEGLKELHDILEIKKLKMEDRNCLAWYSFEMMGVWLSMLCHVLPHKKKQTTNSVCRKNHQSLSCRCIPLSTFPHVVSAAFSPWKMGQTGVHQWLDPNTTFDHHFQHFHIFHIHWFIHRSFSPLEIGMSAFWRVHWVSGEGLGVISRFFWAVSCEVRTGMWENRMTTSSAFLWLLFCLSTSIIGTNTWKVSTWSPWKNTWERHKPGNSKSDLFGMVKTWPFQSLSDLQLGAKKVTLNQLEHFFPLSFCQRSWLGSFAPILPTYVWTAWERCNSPVFGLKLWECKNGNLLNSRGI